MTSAWTNWSRSISATPQRVETPWTTPSLQRVVEQAITDGRRIKAIGSGHSFTGIAAADDIQLDLSKHTGIVALDQHRRRVTLRAGTRLWQIPQLLADTGLAMENLGDINHQSIAGAISTATHGTGLAYGGLSSQVVGVQLLTGTGQTLDVSTDQRPEMLDALRVTLGALGFITQVTLQLVPAYDLHTVQERAPLETIIDSWADLHASHDHFEVFWFGHDDQTITKTSTRRAVTPCRPTLTQTLRHGLFDDAVTNGGLSMLCHLGRIRPGLTPRLNRLATRAWGTSDTVAHWSQAFVSPRRVRFNEMEYAVPLDDVPEVLRELRAMFRRHQISSVFPLELRAAAPESTWLATNHNRRTGYIALHQHFQQDHRDYFARVEPILAAADGRPHWGKVHTMDAGVLAGRYPHWEAVIALRDALDPQRLFANAYLTRILGA